MKKLLHVGVYGVLLRDNAILLVRKTRGPHTGLFDLPGGRIEHGETPEQALKREIQEETGILPITWNLCNNFSWHGKFKEGNEEISFHHLGLVYFISEFCEKNFSSSISEEDVNGCEWLSLNENDSLTPFAKRAVKEFHDNNLTLNLKD